MTFSLNRVENPAYEVDERLFQPEAQSERVIKLLGPVRRLSPIYQVHRDTMNLPDG